MVRAGGARHVGVAGGIDGDAEAIVITTTAQVGGVDQVRAGGIQLRHKRVIIAVVSRLYRVSGGEVGRSGVPRHVGVAGGINGDAVGIVNITAAHVGG